MNASVNIERNSWRLPPDETVQVGDPRSKSAKEVKMFQPAHQVGPSNFRLSFYMNVNCMYNVRNLSVCMLYTCD